ncbi:HET-domain-containing protein [Biscogniauxia sp. FL1348]|nr:HET-domain-containing protein [Biscogniauxia sp. FL1348]
MAEGELLPHVPILQGSSDRLPELKPYQPDPALDLTPEFQRHTCQDCKRLISKLLEHTAGPSPGDYSNIERHLDGVLSTLANSSARCRVCAVIMNQIVCDRAHVQHEFTYYRLSSSSNQNSFCVWLTEDLEAETLFLGDEFEIPKNCSGLDYGIVYTPMSPKLSVSYQPYLVSRDYPWHGKAIDKIKAWMRACEREHVHCPPRHSTALPKRVLEIADDSVSLYISGNEDAQKEDQRYVALSYRWGNDFSLKLTRNTMDTFIEGISISELPATLRDAVHICRNLGFKFIWIDALCIVQDDENDWAEQSAQMVDIYRQSSLNLCAADSAGCGSGMVEMAAPHLMEIAAATAQSTGLTETVVLVGGPIAICMIDVSDCGLQSRGWVFQEGLCSPRGLYVSRRHGLWWDCRTMVDVIDASGPILTGDTNHAFNPLTQRRSFPKPVSLTEHPEDHSMTDSAFRDFSFTWYDWMTLYTSKDLTRQTDRLPAVAGLASYVASLSRMKYKAGLWEEDILRGMTWRRRGLDYAKRIPGGAPTWSWASITGPVYYDQFFTMRVDNRGKIKRHAELDLDITDTTIEEEWPGTMGNVRRGEIKASGVLRPAATMLRKKTWNPMWKLDVQPAEPETDFLESCQETGRREKEYQRVGQGCIMLGYGQHPDISGFSLRDWPKPGLSDREIWGKAKKVALTLV